MDKRVADLTAWLRGQEGDYLMFLLDGGRTVYADRDSPGGPWRVREYLPRVPPSGFSSIVPEGQVVESDEVLAHRILAGRGCL